MERNSQQLCNEYDGNIKQYYHIYNSLDVSNKRQNAIKEHLHEMLKAKKVEDKGIAFLQYILKQELLIQELQVNQTSPKQDFTQIICDIKQSIELDNHNHINRYETLYKDCESHIDLLQAQLEDISILLDTYRDMIGVKVINHRRLHDDFVPEFRTIYNKQSYLDLVKIVKNDMKVGGLEEMRLTQYLTNDLQHKDLKKFM